MHDTIHTGKYTMRYIATNHLVTQNDVWVAIKEALELAITALPTEGHLFVTVVACETFSTAPDECGWAMYHQGIEHIAIAGGDGPDELKDDRQHWLNEIKVSTVHEVVHWWQDLNGTLDGSDRCEKEAEAMAREILDLAEPV